MPSVVAARPWCQFVSWSTASMWRRSSSASDTAGDAARAASHVRAAAAAGLPRGSAVPARAARRARSRCAARARCRATGTSRDHRAHPTVSVGRLRLAEEAQELAREQRDVHGALAQRRQLDLDGVHAVQQVVAEEPLARRAARDRDWSPRGCARRPRPSACRRRDRSSAGRGRAAACPAT